MRAPILLMIGLAACGGVEEGDDPLDEEHGDLVDGADEGHLYQGLAEAGPWRLPAKTRRTGDEQHVGYDGAPPFAGGANCAPGLTAGASMLRNRLIHYFPQISKIGGYVCREVAGLPGVMSQHGTGRALDVFVPTINGNADNTKGDEIANWLVENAQAIGVQSVIWDRTIWRVDHRPRDFDYTGVHPHHDHVHVEITVEASHRNTRWYRDPFGPESCEAIGPMETVLSEDGPCFFAKGPDWKNEPGAGRGGSLSWTRAVARQQALNWARWSLPMKRGGEYLVEVYLDPEWGRFSETRYQVRAGGRSHFAIVDQSNAHGWTSLGSFRFESGDGQSLRIFDNSSAPLEGRLRIVADAIRVRPAP